MNIAKIPTGAAEVAQLADLPVTATIQVTAAINYRDSGTSSRRYYDSSGYSGHSIKDRMIAKLEEMLDDTQSKHEEQFINQWIDRLADN